MQIIKLNKILIPSILLRLLAVGINTDRIAKRKATIIKVGIKSQTLTIQTITRIPIVSKKYCK